MSEVTRILTAIEDGDREAAEQLLPLVYNELRKLAAAKMREEKPGQTLQATALVHEAYLRLVDVEGDRHWDGRGHFFAAAGEAMRRILIDRARDKKRLKRGGEWQRVDLDAVDIALNTPAGALLDLDEALTSLAAEYPESAEIIKLRFFAGLSLGEAASVLKLARRTAERHWAFGRAWLHRRLCQEADTGGA